MLKDEEEENILIDDTNRGPNRFKFQDQDNDNGQDKDQRHLTEHIDQSNLIQNTEINQTQDGLLLNTIPNNSEAGKMEDIMSDESSDLEDKLKLKLEKPIAGNAAVQQPKAKPAKDARSNPRAEVAVSITQPVAGQEADIRNPNTPKKLSIMKSLDSQPNAISQIVLDSMNQIQQFNSS